MTNEERIKSMSTEELALKCSNHIIKYSCPVEFCRQIIHKKNTCKDVWKRWLTSKNETYDMTNEERIKKMGTEELATTCAGHIVCIYCPIKEFCDDNKSDCRKVWKLWLKNENEEVYCQFTQSKAIRGSLPRKHTSDYYDY